MSCSEKHAALEKVRKTHGDLARHSRNWIDRLGEMKLKMRNASLYVWNVLAEERGAQEQRKCSCKVT